jgi:hypothetical protein
MLEGKALVIAIMMLTAAPIAATDSGQIFIGDVRDNFEEMLANDEPTKVSEIIDDSKLDDSDITESDILLTEDSDIPCFTFEEWKKQVVIDRADFVIEDYREESDEKEGARNSDAKDEDERTDDKKEDYYDRDGWADKEEFTKDNDCLTAEEWSLKSESDKKPCFTFEDLEKKMKDDGKNHNNFFGRDKGWDRDEKDFDEGWFEELEILAEACKEGDEEACEELLVIREELAEDRDEEDRDEEERDDEESDEEERDDDTDFRLYLEELKEACDEGDEEACLELREIMAELAEDREEKGGDREGRDRDEACLTMKGWEEKFGDGRKDFDMSKIMRILLDMDDEEVLEIQEALNMTGEEWEAMMAKLESRNMTKEDWNMVMEKMKIFWEDEKGDDRKEQGPHRDAIVREILAELEAACDEGNEEACAELEEIITEFEEREGEAEYCDDDDEDESGEDETDEDESDDEDELNED